MMSVRTLLSRHRGTPHLALGILLLGLGACDSNDRLSPSEEGPLRAVPPVSAAAVAPGIVFASHNLALSQLNTVHTGTILPASKLSLLTSLATVKAKGGRVLLRLHSEPAVRNADGTFNLDKWKAQVVRFKDVNFSSFITDGTIVGHYIFDEPHFQSRWGGRVVPQSTVEAMARYSKGLWPTMHTVVSAPPSWLASPVVGGTTVTYTHLDAGWAIYYAKNGAVSTWIANQVTKAKSKGLGLVASLNVLDGGNGSSGFAGNYPNKFAMSASELRTYGTAMLGQTYVCAFFMWKYTSDYYNRTDIKSAMGALSTQARNHVRTSCRQ